MCDPQTLPATLNAISSPVSGDGAVLSDLPDGLTVARFGLQVAPANLSARQAKALGLLMSGIYGPPSIGSSLTPGLSELLANKLRVSLDSLGSTLFKLTWKTRVTPEGRSISALRASGLRTSGNAYTSVPTPCTQDGPNGGPSQGADRLPGAASLSTVTTPSARDWKDSPGMSEDRDGSPGGRLDQLPRQAQLADSGALPTGGTGGTKSIGQLNPDFSRWLMGFPAVWGNCADTAMLLSRPSRRNSSKRSRS